MSASSKRFSEKGHLTIIHWTKKKKNINDSKRDLDMKDPTEEQSYIAP